MPPLPLPARYLIHCEGRATLMRTASTREEADAKAAELAAEWPGHDFDVFERVASHATTKRGEQRRNTGRVQYFGGHPA